LEYKYLDDEPEGEYRFGLAKCFTNGGTSQMKYLGSYSDGSQLDDALRVNISTGEVELTA
jgi:hypothetical protein